MDRMLRVSFCATIALALSAATAHAALLPVTNTSFPTFDGTSDGIVVGELGTNVITFETDPGVGFGTFVRWDLRLATDSLVTFDSMLGDNPGVATSARMGAAAMSTVDQTISFTESIVDPTVLIAFGLDGFTVDFSPFDISVLDSNGASVTGSQITFPGGVGNNNESLGFTVFGTFGPSSPLEFTITNDTSELAGMNISVATSAVIPTPAAALAIPALLAGLGLRRRSC